MVIDARPACPSDRWAAVWFTVAILALFANAGLIHRIHKPDVTKIELVVILGTLGVIWPVLVAEAVVTARRRHVVPRHRAWRRVLWVALFPPTRMARPHPATGELWLPGLGWRLPGKRLSDELEDALAGPMLIFALCILPVLGIEYAAKDVVSRSVALSLAVQASVAVIWVAFTAEFLIKLSAAAHPARYVKSRWIDLAIVVMPVLEFILAFWAESALVARIARLTRASDHLAKYGRLYRLQSLFAKGWRSVLALEVVARLVGRTPEHRLRTTEARIVELEAELALLREEAEALRKRLSPPVGP